MILTIDTDSYEVDDLVYDLIFNSPDVRELKKKYNPIYGRDIVSLVLARTDNCTLEKLYKEHRLWALFSKSKMVFQPINGYDCDRCMLKCPKKLEVNRLHKKIK